jgi:two-component system sensor histidine kinase PilS (NtrC family)
MTEEDAAGAARTGDRRAGDRRRTDRRHGDRRHSDRRESRHTLPDAPWFEATGAGLDSAWRSVPGDAGAAQAGEADTGAGPTSRWLVREARRVGGAAHDGALARIVRTYVAARAAVGVALVVVQAATGLLGARTSHDVLAVCLLYALQAVVLWLLPSLAELSEPQVQAARRRRQWMATIGVDLVAFGVLHLLESGVSLNFAALLVLPVLMSGVLTTRLMALATSAVVALLLLAVAWRATFTMGEGAVVLAQSGLAGLGMFVIALLAGELAQRLAREEAAARGSLELARQQAQLNRLVIEEMADGVLVVDRRLRVRSANPAARALIVAQGTAPQAPFALVGQPMWVPLAEAVERAWSEGDWPDAGRDVTLAFADGTARVLRARMRFTRRSAPAAQRAPGEAYCVLLLEDVRTVQARVRQEKLAAMGRVSAGIAHEIRNPLAAIAQANALLLEDATDGAQATLARMVADNVRRLQRIVDDVLELAAGPGTDARAIDARAEVDKIVADWATTAGVVSGDGSRLRVELPSQALPVLFDPEHLRRVLVNLLDNALRHATAEPGAVILRLAARDDASAVVSVASDGPPIGPDVEPHLFEPFFSTRSRGSGLGLYICRELCERYGATIDFRPRSAAERHRNGFVVVMRRGVPAAATSTHATL